jgi:50S ribosomal subunit-associated GTPase HflX
MDGRRTGQLGLSGKDQTRTFRRWLANPVQNLKAVLLPDRDEQADEEIAERARAFAPVVWFLGKVQSGKTSIIRVMTGCSAAEVGNGFKACTKTARVFDFPQEAPLIRFLDTRGVGETGYDPTRDPSAASRVAARRCTDDVA